MISLTKTDPSHVTCSSQGYQDKISINWYDKEGGQIRRNFGPFFDPFM